jgi:phospholipid transport system substrate-binding protein
MNNKKNGKFTPLRKVFVVSACAFMFSTAISGTSYAIDSTNSSTGTQTSGATHLTNYSPDISVITVGDEPLNMEEIGSGAQNFVESMASRALDFLTNENLTAEEKKKKFEELLDESFDMKTIGRFSLGRYWRTSTKKQKDEYMRLFHDMIINVYYSRLSEYGGEVFETRKFRPDGTKDIIVNSFIVPESGSEIQIDWRVRYKNSKYQIVDIIVEGVSMSVTQRSDFSSVIQRGGGNVQVLLTHLKEQSSSSEDNEKESTL